MPDDTSHEAAAPAAEAVAPPAGGASKEVAAPVADGLSLDTKKKLDKENLQLRRERDEFARKLKEFEDAKLSETERLTKRLGELEAAEKTWAAERRERDARDAVIAAATDEKVGARNPRALYKLVKDELEFDEKTGEVKNLAAVLKQAKADYPELFGRVGGSVDGGSGSRQSGAGGDMNAWLRGARA